MTSNTSTLLGRVIGIVVGAAVAVALALVAYAMDYPSLGKGMLIGAGAVLIAAPILWRRGARGGLAARVASGAADERERRLISEAGTDAAFFMALASVVGLLAGLFGASAMAVAGATLWVGMITFVVSAWVRSRRG